MAFSSGAFYTNVTSPRSLITYDLRGHTCSKLALWKSCQDGFSLCGIRAGVGPGWDVCWLAWVLVGGSAGTFWARPWSVPCWAFPCIGGCLLACALLGWGLLPSTILLLVAIFILYVFRLRQKLIEDMTGINIATSMSIFIVQRSIYD